MVQIILYSYIPLKQTINLSKNDYLIVTFLYSQGLVIELHNNPWYLGRF